MVSRSFAATNSIMPPRANVRQRVDLGRTRSEAACSRSRGLPAVTAAGATNADRAGSSDRSANSSSASAPRPAIVACRNSAGAVDGERAGGGDLAACRPAAAWSDQRAERCRRARRSTWTGCRLSRGTNASTSTPTQAAPKRISIGASAA